MNQAKLEQFYESLVRNLRSRGVVCAITSGMACVAFGVAQATKDCDILCAPDSADRFLEILQTTKLLGASCSYRGHLSAPLDAGWLRGGWTSHFFWRTSDAEAYLDVFGVAPRGSTPWESELRGFYVSPHIVAEMKRTNRAKDWDFVTALGVKLLKASDPRGWLHIFDEQLLLDLVNESQIPTELVEQRPVLQLAVKRDARLRAALHAEVQFWRELDRLRLHIYERAVRAYMVAVRKIQLPEDANLAAKHAIRVDCAQRHLPLNPLRDYGLERFISEASKTVADLVNPSSLEWLPDVRENFKLLMV